MKTAMILLVSLLPKGRSGILAYEFGKLGGTLRSTHHGLRPSPTISYPSASSLFFVSHRQWASSRRPLASVPSAPSFRATSASASALASSTVDAISISDAYDGGNGVFESARIMEALDDDCDLSVNVKIRPDPFTHLERKQHFQYFSFRATVNSNSPAIKGVFGNKKSIKVKYALLNAGESSYADAFDGYSTFVAPSVSTPFEPDAWTRSGDTSYENGCLTWTHVHDLSDDGDGPSSSTAYFSYFPPFSYDRHLGLIARCEEAKGAKVKSLGQTISGREIDCVTVGTGPRNCWIIHRQHPGESMAEFYAEGLLNRLLGLDGKWDKMTEKAREMYTFHIVPNMNLDGSIAGYLRTNAGGQNLNREWCPSPAPASDGDDAGADADGSRPELYKAPTVERSPEIYNLLRHMDKTGCDAFLDIHGDEALPFNFLAGSQGMSVWGKRLESLHGAFLASYARANSDMQAKVSYEPEEPGQGMPHVCSNQIAERFDCFAGTLEMPFKECWGKEKGWGPERARQLGASVLDPLCYVSPYLRDKSDFWDDFPEEDAYVCPSEKY